MKKKRLDCYCLRKIACSQFILALKLSLVMIFIAIQSVSAGGSPQRITLNFKNTELREVFRLLREKTGYQIIYSEDKLKADKNRVSAEFKNAELSEVLDVVLRDLPFEYVIRDQNVMITPKENVASQQQKATKNRVSGRVTDKNNSPIVGVSVRVKGSNYGTITDDKGNYTITAQPTDVLVFSFVGMVTRELTCGTKDQLNVVLSEDVKQVEDVVVTGFQVVDKRVLTSSITTIKANELDKMGALNIDQMLEGKAPGLMVMNLSSQPGAASKVRVRGAGSFTGSREPLWVIDGVPYEDPVQLSASDINSLDNINLIGNAITGLNPQDIESINVLKDASATAIYGSRAANGVIVVTTKRGKKGIPSLSYSGTFSITDRPSYCDFDLMDSKQRTDVSREIYDRRLVYTSVSATKPVGYEGAVHTYWEDGDFTKFQNAVSKMEALNFDWFDELYRPALTQAHSASLSGGSDAVRYYASIGYNNEKGTEKNVGLERISARSNLDINLRENVLVSIGLDGSVQNADYNHESINVFNTAYYSNRAVGAYEENGDLFYLDRYAGLDEYDEKGNHLGENDKIKRYAKYNILNEMNHSGRSIENKAFNLNASVQWDITKHLRFTTRLGYRNTTNKTEEWADANTYLISNLRGYDLSETPSERYIKYSSSIPFGGLYSNSFIGQVSKSIRNQFNYSQSWNKHNLNVNLTQEATSVTYKGTSDWKSSGYFREQGNSFTTLPGMYIYDPSTYKYLAAIQWVAGSSTPDITNTRSNTLSWVGIITYSYDNRYIFNFNLRQDGSNAFGQYEKNRFRPSWSVSGRWNLHDEMWFIDKMWLNELALRLSYGYRGTAPNASPSLILTNYSQSIAQYYPQYVSSLSSFPNANLRWEKSATLNVGLNFSLFDNRLTGVFDYSRTKSTDLLLTRPVSLVNGITSQLYNGGSKEDHTYEFNLTGQPIRTKNWAWSINLNFTYLKENILVGSDDPVISIDKYLNGTIMTKGFPVDGFFSYHFTGLNDKGLPTYDGMAAEYNSVYECLQGGLVYSGNRLPKYYGGFGTEVRWRNLTFSANFTYKMGHRVRLLEMYPGGYSMPQSNENMSSLFVDRWRKAGDEETTSIPRLNEKQTSVREVGITSAYANKLLGSHGTVESLYDLSDERTARADYIRISSLTLSYRLPKLGAFNNCTVRFQAANVGVITFDKKLKGQDPEQVRNIGMPSLPTFTLGLNIGF